MGITNIRWARDLLTYGQSIPCLLPELGRHILLDGTPDTDLDLARYTPRLSRGLSDQWVSFDLNGNAIDSQEGTVSPCDVPRVHICEQIRAFHRKGQDFAAFGSGGVVCFLVVEGIQGAKCQNLVVRASTEQIAEVALHEAANGFNVVFGGLLQKRQLALLGIENVEFVRVRNLDEMVKKYYAGESGEPVWVCY